MNLLEKIIELWQLFMKPNEFLKKLIAKERVYYEDIIIVMLLVFIYGGLILKEVDRWLSIRPVVSIFLFAIAQYGVYRLGKGNCQFRLMVNLSIYLHLIVVVGSLFVNVPIVSILVFTGVQLLGIYYQYILNNQVVKANERFIKIFCATELISTFFSVNYQLLTYLGRCVVYSEKTQFFPLVVK